MPKKHSKGGAGGIIAILETCESDMATNLAKLENEEQDSQADYDKMSHENELAKTTKENSVKFKTQEVKTLETKISDLSSDTRTAEAEFQAVSEYYAQVKDRCTLKPPSYEERQKRRETEIAGLKDAL